MQYNEWIPAAPTQGLVVCCWSLQGAVGNDGPATAEPALPDGCPELLFNFADPFEHIDRAGARSVQPTLLLVGQITRPFRVRPTGTIDLLAVRFEAHGAVGLHSRLSQLRDRWAAASDLRDADLRQLRSRLASMSVVCRRAEIEGWLASYATVAPRATHAVTAAVLAIRRSHGSVAIDTVAEAQGISVRTLQRQFDAQVGLSPKQFARIVRFHRVCMAWRHDPDTLARVAADSGYCDESHLVRDFRAFVGEPPAAFLSALPAFTDLFLSVRRS